MRGKESFRASRTAVLLSGLVLPGLGQIYQGKLRRGIGLMVSTLACLGILLVRLASSVASLADFRGRHLVSVGQVLDILRAAYQGIDPAVSWLLIALLCLWAISVADAWFDRPASRGPCAEGRDPGPR